MTKARFYEILKEEGFCQEAIDEIYASPQRPNINRLHASSVRQAAKDTNIAIAVAALKGCSIMFIQVN